MADTVRPPAITDALSAPMGELIASIGAGVAQAQREMDAATFQALHAIATGDAEVYALMRQIGYKPTWYHIPEAEAEIQVALTVTGSEEGQGRPTVYAAPVDATYNNRYNWSLQASSKLRFRIVPVPPSTAAESLLVVPQLVGLTMLKARSLAAALGLPLQLPDGATDTDLVATQDPAAGTFLTEGTVTVTKPVPIKPPRSETLVASAVLSGSVRGPA